MNREEFNIALDMSLTKDRIQVCLDYIAEIESRVCESCIRSLETDDGTLTWCTECQNSVSSSCGEGCGLL